MGVVLLGALPAWSQVEPSATGGDIPLDDSRMILPPPVSGAAYPTIGLSEERSNYITGGVSFTGSYVDNVLAGELTQPLAGEIYNIQPYISLDQTTPRQRANLRYAAGYSYYHPTTELNEFDQNASGTYQYRLTPRVAISADDSFLRASNSYQSPTAVPGANDVTDVVTPFGNRITNTGGGAITYQFGIDAMIGASAESSYLNYPNEAQTPGLSNSNAIAVSGFYNRRLSPNRYAGAIILYRHITTSPIDSTIDTYSPSLFYTFFLRRNVSVSVDAGAVYYETSGAGLPSARAWTPSVTASGGWQGHRGAVAANFSRTVSGGGGLIGSYTVTSGSAQFSWRASNRWEAAASASYVDNKNDLTQLYPSGEGGQSIAGTASIGRTFKEHIDFHVGYSRIHERYDGIAAIAVDPDSNRGFVSIAYFFSKPIGR
jgi:hypothetical protein